METENIGTCEVPMDMLAKEETETEHIVTVAVPWDALDEFGHLRGDRLDEFGRLRAPMEPKVESAICLDERFVELDKKKGALKKLLKSDNVLTKAIITTGIAAILMSIPCWACTSAMVSYQEALDKATQVDKLTNETAVVQTLEDMAKTAEDGYYGTVSTEGGLELALLGEALASLGIAKKRRKLEDEIAEKENELYK